MKILRLVPLILSSLILAAHFFRADMLPLVAVSLNIPLLLLLRHKIAYRLIQICLLLGSIEWLRTLYVFAAERQAYEQPWTRLALILGCVALFTALSGLPLSSVIKERQARIKE